MLIYNIICNTFMIHIWSNELIIACVLFYSSFDKHGSMIVNIQFNLSSFFYTWKMKKKGRLNLWFWLAKINDSVCKKKRRKRRIGIIDAGKRSHACFSLVLTKIYFASLVLVATFPIMSQKNKIEASRCIDIKFGSVWYFLPNRERICGIETG